MSSNKNASQRLDDLENAFGSLYGTIDNMARDLMVIKEAVKLLGNKVDSIVKNLNAGTPLTDENIAAVMVQNNANELKGRVDNMIKQGTLLATDTVADNTFVVGRELGDDGSVVNPRIQFLVSALQNKDLAAKLVGHKVGDKIDTGPGKMPFEVLEVYSLNIPQVVSPDAPPADAPAADASAPAAPTSDPSAPSPDAGLSPAAEGGAVESNA